MTTQAAGNGAASTAERKFEREPQKVLRERTTTPQNFVLRGPRIGSTEFIISVHFSNTSTETIEDKILRRLEREELEYAG